MRFSKSQVDRQISRTIARQRAYYSTQLPLLSFLSGVCIGGCLGFVGCLIYVVVR